MDDIETTDAKQIDIRFGKSMNAPFALSQMVDTVIYILLDSSVTVGHVDEVKQVDSVFYVCEKQSGIVHLFNEHGVYIRSVQKKGRASNEYLHLSDFDVSPQTKELHIYDGASHKILVYSANGEHIRNIPIEDAVRDFAVLDNGDYLFYTPDFNNGASQRGLWQTDKSGTFKKQLVSIADDYLSGGVYPYYLSRMNDTTLVLMGGEDLNRVYSITKNTIRVNYQLHFDITIPKSLRQRTTINYMKYAGEIYTKNNFFETDRWMSFTATDMKNIVMVFYDKVLDKQYHLTKEEDIITDILWNGPFEFVTNNTSMGVLYPYQLIDSPLFQERFPSITKESNPILAITYIKK